MSPPFEHFMSSHKLELIGTTVTNIDFHYTILRSIPLSLSVYASNMLTALSLMSEVIGKPVDMDRLLSSISDEARHITAATTCPETPTMLRSMTLVHRDTSACTRLTSHPTPLCPLLIFLMPSTNSHFLPSEREHWSSRLRHPSQALSPRSHSITSCTHLPSVLPWCYLEH
jgi:hypothetical protein